MDTVKEALTLYDRSNPEVSQGMPPNQGHP